MAEVQFGIFCEDIRQEINGKFIIIGVYSGEIVCPQFPYVGRVSIFCGIIDYLAETLLFTVESDSGAVFGRLQLDTELVEGPRPGEVTYVPVPPLQLSLSGPETVRVFVQIADGARQEVCAIRVVKFDPTRLGHALADAVGDRMRPSTAD